MSLFPHLDVKISPSVVDVRFGGMSCGPRVVLDAGGVRPWTEADPEGALQGPGMTLSSGSAVVEVSIGAAGAEPLFSLSDEHAQRASTSLRALLSETPGARFDMGSFTRDLGSTTPEGHAVYVRGVSVWHASTRVRLTGHEVSAQAGQRWEPGGPPLTGRDLIHLLEQILDRALRSAERGLILLSGGMDSSLLAAIASRLGRPLKSICVYEARDAPDASYALDLAGELGLECQEVELTEERFMRILPLTVALFEDARPDILGASGLVAAVDAGARPSDTLIGGEPADAVLGGLRDYATLPDDDAREARRREALAHQSPRDVFLLIRAARAAGARPCVPYADVGLVNRALATPWPALLNPALVDTGRDLGGAGYKLIQREAARLLGGPALQRIAERRKRGLPSASLVNRKRLRARLMGAPDLGLRAPMAVLSAALFQRLVIQGVPPPHVDLDQVIAEVRAGTALHAG